MNKLNLKADIRAGFSVFLLALPLSLGISMASQFPAISGVITAIVGGVVASLVMGSSRLTIKGPAAGLIVIVLGAVTELGMGDMHAGYKKALATIAVAAVFQIIISLCRWATVAEIIPPSVIHGMLAAIGLIIISKQSHVMMGVTPESKKPLALLAEIPQSLTHINPAIFCLGLSSLLLVFFWPRLKKAAAIVPAPLLVLGITIPASLLLGLSIVHDYEFLGKTFAVGPKFLINLPHHLFDSLTFPDFSVVWSPTSIKYIVMFCLVGSIESLLTVCAVDGLDPEKRKSDLNRDLLAVGIGNLMASLCGGLPMISEIVRSRANIDYGAKDRWANFAHGWFLFLSVLFLPGLLQQIPLAALAALLVFTGSRLASPAEFKREWRLGFDEFTYFMATFILTVTVDILVGVGVGIALQILHHFYKGVKPRDFFALQFEQKKEGDTLRLSFTGPVIFSQFLKLRKLIEAKTKEHSGPVILDFSLAPIVDHTVDDKLQTLRKNWPSHKLVFRGMEQHHPREDALKKVG